MSVTSSSDNGYTDSSDITQDRLWFGHQLINGSTEDFLQGRIVLIDLQIYQ